MAVSSGSQELLQSPNDLEGAIITLGHRVLVSQPRELDGLRGAGERLLQEVVIPISIEPT